MTDGSIWCTICKTRPATIGWISSGTSAKLCQSCYDLPRLPVFATTTAPLNGPAQPPPPPERYDPREAWIPRQFSYIPPESPLWRAHVCILWETRVVAPEPFLPADHVRPSADPE